MTLNQATPSKINEWLKRTMKMKIIKKSIKSIQKSMSIVEKWMKTRWISAKTIKNMKTMAKSMKPLKYWGTMRVRDFSSNRQHIACFSSKTQQIGRESAPDWKQKKLQKNTQEISCQKLAIAQIRTCKHTKKHCNCIETNHPPNSEETNSSLWKLCIFDFHKFTSSYVFVLTSSSWLSWQYLW